MMNPRPPSWREALIIGALTVLIAPPASIAETLRICKEQPDAFESVMLPEFDTGIAKRLVVIVKSDDDAKTLKTLAVKKDLWKNNYGLAFNEKGTTEVENVAELRRLVCDFLDIRTDEVHATPGTQLIVLLNPNNEAIASLMDDWSRRHGGLYHNMGMRLRWPTLGHSEKSQKIVYMHLLEPGPKGSEAGREKEHVSRPPADK